LDQEELIPYR